MAHDHGEGKKFLGCNCNYSQISPAGRQVNSFRLMRIANDTPGQDSRLQKTA